MSTLQRLRRQMDIIVSEVRGTGGRREVGEEEEERREGEGEGREGGKRTEKGGRGTGGNVSCIPCPGLLYILPTHSRFQW